MYKPLTCLVLIGQLSACSSLNKSLVLGGTTGLAVGGLAGAMAEPGPNDKYVTRNITAGAAVGLGTGLLFSYLIHRANKSSSNTDNWPKDNVFYGDLPPNPFEVKSTVIEEEKNNE